MKNKQKSTETEIQTVAVKYIKGGKETVKYNTTTGECWIEREVNGEVKITKSFNIA